MKDGLGGKIMTKFVTVRAKTYSYLIDDGSEDKKRNRQKKCVIKRKLDLKIIKTAQKQLNLRIKYNKVKGKMYKVKCTRYNVRSTQVYTGLHFFLPKKTKKKIYNQIYIELHNYQIPDYTGQSLKRKNMFNYGSSEGMVLSHYIRKMREVLV